MQSRLKILLGALCLPVVAFGADREVHLTIYNQDMAVVREVRNVDVGDGNSLSISDVAASIDPTSVKLSLTNGYVVEQNFEYDLVSQERLLERRLGEQVDVLLQEGGVVSGKLLTSSSWGMVLETPKELRLIESGVRQILLPGNSQGLYIKPTLVWKLDGRAKGKQSVELSYTTNNISWTAEYIAVLAPSGGKLDMQGWVDINNNSGASYPDANLKLIAGDIHRVEQNERAYPTAYGAAKMQAMDMAPSPQFEQRDLFEYHLYELQRPSTVGDRERKQISLLTANEIPYKQKFAYNIQPQNKQVEVTIEFKSDKSSGLEIPLPAGRVRIFQSEASGNREFVGEDRIKHTPVDSDVKLKVGNAFDVTAETVQLKYRQITDRVRETDYKVTLKNSKPSDVTVIATQNSYGEWSIRDATIEPTDKSATEKEFTVKVPARGETVFTYTLRQGA